MTSTLPSALVLALFLLLLSATEARPDPSLSARLQAGADGTSQCWESLMELRSCSVEVVLFFLNGETYLGPSCCHAIHVIEHKCWAADAMLATLGFTAQEGDILRGYCDAAGPSEGSAAPSPLPPPHAAAGPASEVKPVHALRLSARLE